MSGCERCGEPDHCACYHDACCTCGSKGHASCGQHPLVNSSAGHGDNCATCSMAAAGSTAGLEFDTSPETLLRLRDALRGGPGQQ